MFAVLGAHYLDQAGVEAALLSGITPPAPAQRRHRILRIASEVVPPLQRAKAETQRQARHRMPPNSPDDGESANKGPMMAKRSRAQPSGSEPRFSPGIRLSSWY
jgi:hypothetical protein